MLVLNPEPLQDLPASESEMQLHSHPRLLSPPPPFPALLHPRVGGGNRSSLLGLRSPHCAVGMLPQFP